MTVSNLNLATKIYEKCNELKEIKSKFSAKTLKPNETLTISFHDGTKFIFSDYGVVREILNASKKVLTERIKELDTQFDEL